MSKHTPGPWVIIPGGDEWSQGRIATIEPKPETMIETNYWTVAEVNIRRDESESNALLIAAAPDLLHALEACLMQMERYNCIPHPEGVAGARSFNISRHAASVAISKARGESK